jgi:hypothetical protein
VPIKPLYLLADSQLLFLKDGPNSLPERIRAEVAGAHPKAAYIGASNGDKPEFYNLFVAAMDAMGISTSRMIPTQPVTDDFLFLEDAELILLAGGDMEQGWQAFERNGLKDLISRKRYDGATLIGVSAGAIQLGLGALSNSARQKELKFFRFAPFYIGAHDEENDWWDLRALLTLSQSEVKAIGIAMGGGAIYFADGTLEPVRKPLIELLKQDGKIIQNLLMPLPA